MIKTDLTKSYQVKVSKTSIPYLGTITPFKGLRVYLRSAMRQPGSQEALQELMSRVFGDFLQEGFVLIIADDLHVCGNSIPELYTNWIKVLQRAQENNLTFSPSKTVIGPNSSWLDVGLWTLISYAS